MNYLFYPTKVMGITQTYLGMFSHEKSYKGKPQSFPIDEACSDTGRDWLYCTCDELEVKKIYGVGISGGNTFWLQSTSKVKTPTFEDFITIMVVHPNDDDMSKLKIGQKFKRGEQIVREGKDGDATGNHFHIEVAKGKFAGAGWLKNSLGAWVISGDSRKPEECFYIDPTFTTIRNARDLKFIKLYGTPIVKDTSKRQVEVLVDNLRIRKEPNGEILGYIKKGIYDILEEKDGWLKIDGGYIGIGKWLVIYERIEIEEPTPNEPILDKLLKALLDLVNLLIDKLKGGKI